MPTIRERLERWFLGDDVFLSYSREKGAGAPYAVALADRLTARGLFCTFDQWGSEPAERTPEELLRRARRCGLMVIVGTRSAGQSAEVEREIEEFKHTGRAILPIDLDGTIREARWWPLIAGVYVSSETEGATSVSPDVEERIAKACSFRTRDRRMRRGIGIAGAFLVVLTTLAAVAGFLGLKFAQQAEAEMQRGRAATARANEAEQRSRTAERLATSRQLAVASGNSSVDPELAVLLAAKAIEYSPSREAIEALRAALLRPSPAAKIRNLGTREGRGPAPVVSVAFSSDSRRVAFAGRKVIVWDVDARRRVASIEPYSRRNEVCSEDNGLLKLVRLDSGGNHLAVHSECQYSVWDIDAKRRFGAVRAAMFSASPAIFGPPGQLISLAEGYVLRDEGQEIHVPTKIVFWDWRTSAVRREMEIEEASDFRIVGRSIVTIDENGLVTWHPSKRSLQIDGPRDADGVSACLSEDGRYAAVLAESGTTILQLATRRRVTVPTYPEGASQDATNAIHAVTTEWLRLEVSFDAAGKLFTFPNGTSTTIVRSTVDGRPVVTLRDSGPIFAVALSPDGRHVATGGRDGGQVYDLTADLSLAELLELAKRRVPRTLTDKELQAHVGTPTTAARRAAQ